MQLSSVLCLLYNFLFNLGDLFTTACTLRFSECLPLHVPSYHTSQQGPPGNFWPRRKVQLRGPWCSNSAPSPSFLPHPRLNPCSRYSLLIGWIGLDSAWCTNSGFLNCLAGGGRRLQGGAGVAWLRLAGGGEPLVGHRASLYSEMVFTMHAVWWDRVLCSALIPYLTIHQFSTINKQFLQGHPWRIHFGNVY